MRCSSQPEDPGLGDCIPMSRGVGLKVFNVEGENFEQEKDLNPGRQIE